MFQKYRSYLMIVVGLALAALVWLDNRPEPAPAGKSIAVVQAKPADETPPATQGETLEAGEGEPQGDVAPNAAAGLALTNPLSSLAREEFSDWVARPLFAPSRKRPPKRPAPRRKRPLRRRSLAMSSWESCAKARTPWPCCAIRSMARACAWKSAMWSAAGALQKSNGRPSFWSVARVWRKRFRCSARPMANAPR